MTIDIRPARSEAEPAACFPVIQALHPHLSGPAEMTERILRRFDQGYHVLAAGQDNAVIGAAGYRVPENLIRDRFCYLDNLVVGPSHRCNAWARACWTPSHNRLAPPGSVCRTFAYNVLACLSARNPTTSITYRDLAPTLRRC